MLIVYNKSCEFRVFFDEDLIFVNFGSTFEFSTVINLSHIIIY